MSTCWVGGLGRLILLYRVRLLPGGLVKLANGIQTCFRPRAARVNCRQLTVELDGCRVLGDTMIVVGAFVHGFQQLAASLVRRNQARPFTDCFVLLATEFVCF